MSNLTPERHIGFWGATGIGIGAMIGGGILALAGIAFSVSGPSAILAFLLNGLIAYLTVFSFSEMAAAHPQNGGIYNFAKKALSVQAAFGVGWVVWFASIIAAVLYAMGFGAFLVIAIQQVVPDITFSIFGIRGFSVIFGILAISWFTYRLSSVGGGSGLIANFGKLIAFAVIIAAGFAVIFKTPFAEVTNSFRPFFTGGFTGILAAMGYTFITLQGFGLISNAGGEIKNPEKNIPRAMAATVGIGLLVYIPLLFVIVAAGTDADSTITAMSMQQPEAVVAVAAQNFIGPFGFWLVIFAGLFSMLSALEANIFAASRVAFVMAKDRTLPIELSEADEKTNLPKNAIYTTAVLAGLLLIAIPNLAAAGAASGLIFLLTYALAHIISMLMRFRNYESTKHFRSPLFPVIPIIGMFACAGLALFQAFAEPAAGIISLLWLSAGIGLFVAFFIQNARVIDVSGEAMDPELVKLRGHSPLVLVPIVNPANASSKVFLADSITPPNAGRALLLSILEKRSDKEDFRKILRNNQEAMAEAISTAYSTGLKADMLTTFADKPLDEIMRVAKTHRCSSVLMGLTQISENQTMHELEQFVRTVHCDAVILKQPYTGWNIKDVSRILVPVAGYAEHDLLRANIIASLWRSVKPVFSFIRILPEDTSAKKIKKQRRKIELFAQQIVPDNYQTQIILNNNPADLLVNLSKNHDLIILGLGKRDSEHNVFGELPIRLAKESATAQIYISNR
jgi:amino acid transporter